MSVEYRVNLGSAAVQGSCDLKEHFQWELKWGARRKEHKDGEYNGGKMCNRKSFFFLCLFCCLLSLYFFFFQFYCDTVDL